MADKVILIIFLLYFSHANSGVLVRTDIVQIHIPRKRFRLFYEPFLKILSILLYLADL